MALLQRLANFVRKGHITSSVLDNRGSWWGGFWNRIFEPFAGAWQRNIEWTVDSVLAHNAVYACITLIASDIGKLRPKLVEQNTDGIWDETSSAAFAPVLRKPNHYQNRIQFFEWWVQSKLIRGNTYVFKERDGRDVVVKLHILDPSRVSVLIAPDGSVFYQLQADNLAGHEAAITLPASEIIHDRINCLFHPLVGVSPLFACGLAATAGISIVNNSAFFFKNGSNPSGVLTAPGVIDEPTAKILSDRWNAMYSGEGSGKVAVMGNNLKFEPLRMSAVDSQLIEQLKWTADTVCSVFHVPPFKIGVGPMPTYQNGEILNQIYYSDCLQSHIEQMELALDEGLGLTETPRRTLGVEFDLDTLLRMDSATQIQSLTEGIKGGLFTPNEARKKVDQKPLVGGDTVYMQEQNFSLAALDARDRENPLAPSNQPKPVPTVVAQPVDDEDDEAEERAYVAALNLHLLSYANANQLRLRAA